MLDSMWNHVVFIIAQLIVSYTYLQKIFKNTIEKSSIYKTKCTEQKPKCKAKFVKKNMNTSKNT